MSKAEYHIVSSLINSRTRVEAGKQQRHLRKILRKVTSSDPSPFLKIAE